MEKVTEDNKTDDLLSRAIENRLGRQRRGTNEHSGLHDIRRLARSTQNRFAEEEASERAAEEALLASSQSLNSIALPVPGKELPVAPVMEARQSQSIEDFKTPAPIQTKSVRKSKSKENAFKKEVIVPVTEPEVFKENKRSFMPFVVGGLAVLAIGAAAFVILGGGGDGPVKAETPETAVQANNALLPSQPTEEAVIPPVEEVEEPEPEEEIVEPTPVEPVKVATKSEKVVKKEKTAKVAAAKSEEATQPAAIEKVEEAAKPKKAAGDDELLGLLEEATTKPSADEDELRNLKGSRSVKTKLTSSDAKAGMKKVRSKAQQCASKHQQYGNVVVRFTVQPDGTVSKAHAGGAHKGTPVGNCVAAAAKTASFPAFQGTRQTFSYPFLLTE